MRKEKFDLRLLENIPIPEDVIAVSLSGSHLHGLARPESDLDLVFITRNGKPSQIIHEGQDIVKTPWSNFFDRVMNGATPECSMLAGGQLHFFDENYRPFFESLRYNPYLLYENFRIYSYRTLKWLYTSERSPRQVQKTFKTIARNHLLMEKLERGGGNFDPVFTLEEKGRYEALVSELLEAFSAGVSFEELREFLEL